MLIGMNLLVNTGITLWTYITVALSLVHKLEIRT